ncbi:hypothetical protein ACWDBW_31730 [Streptomyces sp. NPDC001107]
MTVIERRIPKPAPHRAATASSAADTRADDNLSRLRRENSDLRLRRTPALYEEAIRQLALENSALRGGSLVVAVPTRTLPAPPLTPNSPGGACGPGRTCVDGAV